MNIRRATFTNRLLAFLDWKEQWQTYYCFNGGVHYIVPERWWPMAENEGCPHCGEELKPTSQLVGPEDYAL